MAPPYEPLESATLQAISFKTVFLVAILSAARVSELQALDVRPELLRIFDNKVVLRLNPAFLPKVLNQDYMLHEIELEAFSPETPQGSHFVLKTLCPVRAVKLYVQKTKDIRKDHNLFVSYAAAHVGCRVSSQSISRWVRDTICSAYRHFGVVLPRSEVSAHSTRAVAASLANIAGVSPRDLCAAAMWSSFSVFAKFYRLDMVSSRSLSSRILQQAMHS